MQVSREIGSFCKSTVKIGIKQHFRHQNPQTGHVGPDSTRFLLITHILLTKNIVTQTKIQIFIPNHITHFQYQGKSGVKYSNTIIHYNFGF